MLVLVVNQDFATHGRQETGGLGPVMAVANQAHHRTSQLTAPVSLSVPEALSDFLISLVEAVEPGQNHSQNMFGNGQAIPFRSVD